MAALRQLDGLLASGSIENARSAVKVSESRRDLQEALESAWKDPRLERTA